MQITEFTNQMVTLIKSKVSTEMKNVQSHTIWKNNGIQEEGITLIEKGVNISPTVYMREYYDRFLQGETLRALAEEVIEELERCKTYKSMDISFFLSFENAKKHIVYKLVNREKNEELLKLIEKLKNGQSIALVSDAGTPGICDPGEVVIKKCIKEEIKVVPVPGACAFVNALISSGLNTDTFLFLGFLPLNKKNRKQKLCIYNSCK